MRDRPYSPHGADGQGDDGECAVHGIMQYVSTRNLPPTIRAIMKCAAAVADNVLHVYVWPTIFYSSVAARHLTISVVSRSSVGAATRVYIIPILSARPLFNVRPLSRLFNFLVNCFQTAPTPQRCHERVLYTTVLPPKPLRRRKVSVPVQYSFAVLIDALTPTHRLRYGSTKSDERCPSHVQRTTVQVF